jgi:alkanesulfonate monooxygenase SsuD/methylene tetrahydromethanopterin reductase-like flavin-dependent oxidoreductase (luciferase family)
LSGGPEEIAEGLRAYRREGIDLMQISVDNISMGAIERLGPALELLRKSD